MSYLSISGKRYHIGLATDFFDKGYHRVYINKFLFGMRVKNPTFEQSKKILKKYIARGLMEVSDEQSIGETINLHSEKKYY